MIKIQPQKGGFPYQIFIKNIYSIGHCVQKKVVWRKNLSATVADMASKNGTHWIICFRLNI